jgi:ABC-type multidrug transport system permease subunit
MVVRKDLLRKLRSPLAPIVYLAFPIFFALLIGLTFGSHGDKIAPVKLALVDDDKGLAARLIKSSFSQSQSSERFDVEPVDTYDEGLRLVEDDKVSALIRIPPGFTDSLLDGNRTHLEVVKNPAQGIYPQIAEEFVKVLALGGGSAVRVLEGPLQTIRGATKGNAPPNDAFISNVSVAINHRMRGVGRYAIPPAIRVEDVKPPSTKTADNSSPFKIALFVLPGMAVFSIMMMSLGSMFDFPREIAQGTLARQLLAPIHASDVIFGKITATWILGIVCIVVLAIVAVIWAGAGIGSVPGFLALSLAFALAATGFAALIQSASRSERGGPVVGSILVMIMSMFGGTWIPLDSLPAVVRKFSPYTLTYWAGEGYRHLMFNGAGFGQLLPNLGVLFAMGVALSIVAVFLFRRRFEVGA